MSKGTTGVMYAEVAPAVALPATGSHTYTYRVPRGERAVLYRQVEVPFGKRRVAGVIMGVTRTAPAYPTKELVVKSAELTESQVALARWIARTMHGGLGYTLRLFLPPAGASSPTRSTVPPVPARLVVRKIARQLLVDVHYSEVALVQQDVTARTRQVGTLVAAVVAEQQQALILVPESWVAERVEVALPSSLKHTTAVVSAGVSARAYREVWHGVRDGKTAVVIGTHKALYLPWQRLGVVVVEEESWVAHKQWDQYPRLHNAYAAEVLSALHHTHILSTTAVPSLRLRFREEQGKIQVKRTGTVRLRSAVMSIAWQERGQRKLLPEAFVTTLKGWLHRRERVLIFHNVRGAWRALVCRDCQAALRCAECGSVLALHRHGRAQELRCHQCGQREPVPPACSRCGKQRLSAFGAGAEKVEEILKTIVGRGVEIVRVDAGTVPYLSAAKLAGGRRPQIVIGTAAVFAAVAGATFDHVVFLFPERSLLYPDFRSTERTYLLLARLQGLLPVGRNVTVVTRQQRLVEETLVLPDAAWYRREKEQRARLLYYPFRDMVRLTVRAAKVATVQARAAAVREAIEKGAHELGVTGLTVRGPFASLEPQRRGRHDVHLLLLGQLPDLTRLYEGLKVDVVDVAPERIL